MSTSSVSQSVSQSVRVCGWEGGSLLHSLSLTVAWLGLAWLGLALLGLAWLAGLGWAGLGWVGLGWAGWVVMYVV